MVTLGLLGNCDPRGSLGEINLALAVIVLKLSIFILSLPNSKHWRLGVSFAFLQRWTSKVTCLFFFFFFCLNSYNNGVELLPEKRYSVVSIFNFCIGNVLIFLIWLKVCIYMEIISLQTLKVLLSVQFSSVALSCPTLCDPMDCSMWGLLVYHQLLECTHIHVHRDGDAIQPSHPLPSPSPPALNLSQHQGLFKWISSSHQMAKGLEFQLQHQSFQWTPRTDFL